MKKQSLSVVLATFNEEEKLPDCLSSIALFGNVLKEIIVVDGSSTDRTVSVAKEFGASVFLTDNPPNFHINKQKAIDAAGGEWILQLDADERITQELAEEINSVISRGGEKNGYWIPRKNYFLGRFLMKGGQYPDYTLRLYRRGKGRLPQKSVHEQAVVEGEVGYLKHPLLHIADDNFSRYRLRFGRYTDLIAKELHGSIKKYDVLWAMKYVFFFPIRWFLLTYIRHKGFMDGWQGLLFSFFSAMRFPVSYMKFLVRHEGKVKT